MGKLLTYPESFGIAVKSSIKRTASESASDAGVIARDSDSALPARTARMLLRVIRAAQPIPKIELARRLDLNRATVTTALRPYLASGLLREEAVQPVVRSGGRVGRPPVGLSFATDREFFVGINIGVRRSQVGITTLGGEVLEDEDFDTPPGHLNALALIRASVDRLSAKAGGRTLKVIGVSVPGPADSERKRLIYAPRLDWRDVPIEEHLRRGKRDRHRSRFPPEPAQNHLSPGISCQSLRIAGWTVEPGEPRGSGLGSGLEVAVEEFLTNGALR